MLAIGENSLDQLCVVDTPPPRGGKREVLEWHELPGGQTASAALACARLGLRVAYAGAVGNDPAADRVLEPLRRGGVDLARVRRVAGAATRRAMIQVERAGGERTIWYRRDPRMVLRREDVPRARIQAARLVLLDAGDPELASWVAGVAAEAGVPVVLDADTPGPGIAELLDRVPFPVISRDLAVALGEGGSPREGLSRIAGPAVCMAVVTLGAEGALARWQGRVLETPAFHVAVSDTTGAGDAFHAGFACGILEGRDAHGVLRVAHAVAALACRALGAQAGLPTREELERLLALDAG